MRPRIWPPVLALLLLSAGCAGEKAGGPLPGEAVPARTVWFEDRARDVGVDFERWNGMSGRLYLAEITCGGAALFDADGDSDLDLYVLQGAPLGEMAVEDGLLTPRHPLPLTDRLYRNDLVGATAVEGGFSFTDVTDSMGVSTTGYGCAVATGDYDGDGRVDLYVVNLGRNQLLRNLGPDAAGVVAFEDVTEQAGVGDEGPGATALFFDLEGDGDLDLYVGNYGDFSPRFESPCFDLSGAPDYCGPGAYPPRHDRLYRNLGPELSGAESAPAGAGRFEDITEWSGLGAAPARATLGSVAGDFNGDGHVDLYLAHDGEPNHLWIGAGDGTFEERALLSGAALNGRGAAEASMGVDAGDWDDDGDLDLFMTHLVKETHTLYTNDGRANFRDATTSAGLGAPSLAATSFGTAFFDADNDGLLDLAVASGAVTRVPAQVAAGDVLPLRQRDQLFVQRPASAGTAAGSFREVSAQAGPGFEVAGVSRGLAVGDLDNDGDADLVITEVAGPVRLLVNGGEGRRPWLGVRAVMGTPARDALGAFAAVLVDGEPSRWRRASTDGSFASARDPRLLFGLGDAAFADRVTAVRVLWADGGREDFPVTGDDLGRYLTLAQGAGQPADAP